MTPTGRRAGTWAPPAGWPVVNLDHLAYFHRGDRRDRPHCLILVMAGAPPVVVDHDGAEAQDLSERSLRVALSLAAGSEGMAGHITRMPRYARVPRASSTSTTRRIK